MRTRNALSKMGRALKAALFPTLVIVCLTIFPYAALSHTMQLVKKEYPVGAEVILDPTRISKSETRRLKERYPELQPNQAYIIEGYDLGLQWTPLVRIRPISDSNNVFVARPLRLRVVRKPAPAQKEG